MRKVDRYDEYMSVSWRDLFRQAWQEITTELKLYELTKVKITPPKDSEEYAYMKAKGKL